MPASGPDQCVEAEDATHETALRLQWIQIQTNTARSHLLNKKIYNICKIHNTKVMAEIKHFLPKCCLLLFVCLCLRLFWTLDELQY